MILRVFGRVRRPVSAYVQHKGRRHPRRPTTLPIVERLQCCASCRSNPGRRRTATGQNRTSSPVNEQINIGLSFVGYLRGTRTAADGQERPVSSATASGSNTLEAVIHSAASPGKSKRLFRWVTKDSKRPRTPFKHLLMHSVTLLQANSH